MTTKIIGCGNPLAGDDGLGVHVIDQLKIMSLPEGVTAAEGGTDPLNLLEMLRGEDKVILVDAVKGAGRPGEVFVLALGQLDLGADTGLSLHHFNLSHVLTLGQTLFPAEMPREIVVIGVEAQDTSPYNLRLSPVVEASLPKVIQTVMEELSIPRE